MVLCKHSNFCVPNMTTFFFFLQKLSVKNPFFWFLVQNDFYFSTFLSKSFLQRKEKDEEYFFFEKYINFLHIKNTVEKKMT